MLQSNFTSPLSISDVPVIEYGFSKIIYNQIKYGTPGLFNVEDFFKKNYHSKLKVLT
jgi:hypothetical protein